MQTQTRSPWTIGYEAGLINFWIQTNGWYYNATLETMQTQPVANPFPAGSDGHRDWAGAEAMGREDAERLA